MCQVTSYTSTETTEMTGIRTPEQTVRELQAGFGNGTDRLFSLLWDVVDNEIAEAMYVLTDVGVPDHTVSAVSQRMRAWGVQHFNPDNY